MTSDQDHDATGAVKRLFFAVSTDDGEGVWAALTEDARAYVINVAVRQGMDFDLASRLRDGSASAAERAEYLENLTRGIRRDLGDIDLSDLAYEVEEDDGGRVRVRYQVPLGLTVRPRGADGQEGRVSIPVGSAMVARQDGRWLVDRLVPRPS